MRPLLQSRATSIFIRTTRPAAIELPHLACIELYSINEEWTYGVGKMEGSTRARKCGVISERCAGEVRKPRYRCQGLCRRLALHLGPPEVPERFSVKRNLHFPPPFEARNAFKKPRICHNHQAYTLLAHLQTTHHSSPVQIQNGCVSPPAFLHSALHEVRHVILSRLHIAR